MVQHYSSLFALKLVFSFIHKLLLENFGCRFSFPYLASVSSPTQFGLYARICKLLPDFLYLLCLHVFFLVCCPQPQLMVHALHCPHSDHCALNFFTQQYLTFISRQCSKFPEDPIIFWSLQIYPALEMRMIFPSLVDRLDKTYYGVSL